MNYQRLCMRLAVHLMELRVPVSSTLSVKSVVGSVAMLMTAHILYMGGI